MTARPLERADCATCQDVERDAGERFLAVDMPEIAFDDPPDVALLARFVERGHAWAWDEDGEVAGYILVDIVDAAVHVEQVSVRSAYAGRRIGRSLVDHASEWARARGIERVTLTTFAAVPWNAPYYVRLGFRELPEDEWGPELRAVVRREVEHGLHRWPPVVMVRDAGFAT